MWSGITSRTIISQPNSSAIDFKTSLKYSEIFKLYSALKGEACRSFCQHTYVDVLNHIQIAYDG